MNGWAKGLKSWLDIFLESKCPLCERSTSGVICPTCQRQLQQCRLPHPYQQAALPIMAWGEYGGALKRAIASLKYENHPQLARPLGQWLAQSWLSAKLPLKNSIVVVPIPMHPDKVAQRGFNQAELIAQSFCETTGLPLKRHGLARIQATEAQFKLSPQAREQNLAGVFALGKDFLRQHPTETVLLIDDIYTTGATVLTPPSTVSAPSPENRPGSPVQLKSLICSDTAAASRTGLKLKDKE
jgi:ComF family protein